MLGEKEKANSKVGALLRGKFFVAYSSVFKIVTERKLFILFHVLMRI